MQAIILAGGLGTRLRSVVSDVPKPLAPVAGRPFLEHLMDYWIAQGAARFVLSVGYRRELIEKHFGGAYRSVPVAYAVEREPLGTGGGLLLALESASGDRPLFAANGDSFFAVDTAAMLGFHEANKADFTLALFRSPDTRRYTPVEADADGKLSSLRAQPGARSSLVNGGVYLFRREVLARAGFAAGSRVSLEDEVFPALLARGARMFGFAVDAPFIDIGVPEDYARAAAVIAAAR